MEKEKPYMANLIILIIFGSKLNFTSVQFGEKNI